MQQHLLIDADDTLWENNIYFERAIEQFVNFLNHSSLKTEEIRAVLDEIEMTMGYGSEAFAKSLQETYRQLAEREVSGADLAQVGSFARQIIEHPIEAIAGVPETLAYLAPRHRLILVTKGHEEEQRLKIDASGLGMYFEHTIVVAEKDVETYHRLIHELALDVPATWMIGNSPRSDINPARKAGLNTIFIPNANTWRLEHEEITTDGTSKLLQLERFTELREHF